MAISIQLPYKACCKGSLLVCILYCDYCFHLPPTIVWSCPSWKVLNVNSIQHNMEVFHRAGHIYHVTVVLWSYKLPTVWMWWSLITCSVCLSHCSDLVVLWCYINITQLGYGISISAVTKDVYIVVFANHYHGNLRWGIITYCRELP